MNKKLQTAFQTLTETELALFLRDDMRFAQEDPAFSQTVLSQTLQKAGLKPTGKETPMKKIHQKKHWKICLVAAALAVLVAFSAVAVTQFILPKQLAAALSVVPDSIKTVVNADEATPDTVQTVQKTQTSNGLVITFEAIAQGKLCVSSIWADEKGNTVQADRTYAIFSIRSEDGSPFYGNQDGKGWTLPYQAPNFGYNLLLSGYAPNPSALIDCHDIYNYEEGNVLYKAYDITDALPFADKAPYIVINDGMVVGPEILRVNKDGHFYYDDAYTGIRALFDLNLDPSLADAAQQAQALKTQPLYTYEEIVKLFLAEGRDYDTYTDIAS